MYLFFFCSSIPTFFHLNKCNTVQYNQYPAYNTVQYPAYNTLYIIQYNTLYMYIIQYSTIQYSALPLPLAPSLTDHHPNRHGAVAIPFRDLRRRRGTSREPLFATHHGLLEIRPPLLLLFLLLLSSIVPLVRRAGRGTRLRAPSVSQVARAGLMEGRGGGRGGGGGRGAGRVSSARRICIRGGLAGRGASAVGGHIDSLFWWALDRD